MQVKSVLLSLLLLCLFATAAAADGIASISPAVIPLGAIEEFISIRGDGLQGTVSTLVVFDGAQSIEPGIVSPGLLVVWVPAAVVLTPGVHTVEVYATDLQGVRRLGPATLTVAEPAPEPGPPTLTVPEAVIVEYAPLRTGTPVFFDVTAAHFDGSPATAACTPESGSGFPLHTTIVTCTASDQYGSSAASFPVVVSDLTAPILTLPQDLTVAYPVVTFATTASDNVDGDVPVTCTPASGSTFPAGTTIVQCRAFDSSFNYAFGSFKVTVTAGGAPALTVPDSFFAAATEPGGARVSYDVTATGDATISCTPPSGSVFAFGTTTVNCTASNPYGSDSDSFTVTVVDWTAPVLTLPSPTVNASSASGAVVHYTASATDAVDGVVPITCQPPSGGTFAVGVTVVECTAADLSGNRAYGQFNVTVLLDTDTTPPVITSVTASPDLLWPPNHKMVSVTVTVRATDDHDPAPVSRIVSVSSDQPVNGTGDGDAAPDWVMTGPLTVDLRAERAADKDRTYTVVVETRDAAGNASRGVVKVKVAQTRRRAV